MAGLGACPTARAEGPVSRGAPRNAPCPHHGACCKASSRHFIARLCCSAARGDSSRAGVESFGRPGSERRAPSCEQGREMQSSVTSACSHVFISSRSLKKAVVSKAEIQALPPSPSPSHCPGRSLPSGFCSRAGFLHPCRQPNRGHGKFWEQLFLPGSFLDFVPLLQRHLQMLGL